MFEGIKETSSNCFNMLEQNAGVRSSHLPMSTGSHWSIKAVLKAGKPCIQKASSAISANATTCSNCLSTCAVTKSKVKSGNSSVAKSVKTLSLFGFAWNSWPMASGITTKHATDTQMERWIEGLQEIDQTPKSLDQAWDTEDTWRKRTKESMTFDESTR